MLELLSTRPLQVKGFGKHELTADPQVHGVYFTLWEREKREKLSCHQAEPALLLASLVAKVLASHASTGKRGTGCWCDPHSG